MALDLKIISPAVVSFGPKRRQRPRRRQRTRKSETEIDDVEPARNSNWKYEVMRRLYSPFSVRRPRGRTGREEELDVPEVRSRGRSCGAAKASGRHIYTSASDSQVQQNTASNVFHFTHDDEQALKN